MMRDDTGGRIIKRMESVMKVIEEPAEVECPARVVAAIISASKTCTAFVELPGDKPNLLGLKPGIG